MWKSAERGRENGRCQIRSSLSLVKLESLFLLSHCRETTKLQFIKVSECPSTAASRMDGISSGYNRKWMGLPRCFSETGLFGKNMQQLPLKSMNIRFKQEKTLLVVELRVYPGVDQAISRLQNKEFVERVQDNQAGLGWGEPVHFWSKATRKQQKAVDVEEVRLGLQSSTPVRTATGGSGELLPPPGGVLGRGKTPVNGGSSWLPCSWCSTRFN